MPFDYFAKNLSRAHFLDQIISSLKTYDVLEIEHINKREWNELWFICEEGHGAANGNAFGVLVVWLKL